MWVAKASWAHRCKFIGHGIVDWLIDFLKVSLNLSLGTSYQLIPTGTHMPWSIIGIDHDTVCAGVVGTAIRNSTSCAGRRAAACGRAGRHNECCSGLQYQPRQRRPYKWSISILPRSQFTKSKGNLRFRRLVPLFVPIGVCVTTHDDGTASDVTIGMWRHNQQVTNHERNGKPWFSLSK